MLRLTIFILLVSQLTMRRSVNCCGEKRRPRSPTFADAAPWLLLIQREAAFHCSLTMLIMVSQSLQPCLHSLHSQVTEHQQNRSQLSLQCGGGDSTTMRKQEGTPGIRENLIFVTPTFNRVCNNETNSIPRLERESMKVSKWSHHYDAKPLPPQSSLWSYVPLGILFTLTEVKAGAKAKNNKNNEPWS